VTQLSASAGRWRNLSSLLARVSPWLAVLAAALVVFSQIVGFDLLSWDDRLHLVDNPHLFPPRLAGLFELWTRPYFGEYVPATYTFFFIETLLGAALTGRSAAGVAASPWVYHLGSLALHLACIGMVYRLVLQCVGTRWPSAMGAALFALHPLQVETVAWISETRNLLATLFSLLALERYLRFLDVSPATPLFQTIDAKDFHRKLQWRSFFAATFWFVLALLSKPTAVATPLVAAAIQWFAVGQGLRRTAPALVLWCALAVGAIAIASVGQPSARLLDRTAWHRRPLVAADSAGFYLVKWIVPANLGPDHGRPPRLILESPDYVTLAALLAAGLAAVWARPPKVWRTSLAVFLAGLAPTLGLIPFAFQWVSTTADRYVYFAMLGPAILFGWMCSQLSHRWLIAISVAWLTSLGALSFWQAGYWKDDFSLFTRAVAVRPSSALFHYNLGQHLHTRGDRVGAKRHYEAAIQADATNASAHFNLGTIEEADGNVAAALAHYHLAQLDRSLTKAPRAAARLLVREGRPADAVECLRLALSFGAEDLDVANDLAWILATTNDPKVRDGAQATTIAQRVCFETAGSRPEYLDTQATALAAAGRFEEAVRVQQSAVAMARRHGNPSMADDLERRLDLFRRRKAVVE
jgi:Flp pilus assembly protein TadD